MEDKLSIRVNVADRYYPLRIDRKDEERIRKAARLINDKLMQYKQRYTDKDLQDFLAMVALQYVIKLLEQEDRNDTTPILDMVKELNDKLDTVLSEEL
ncbi:MAG: cell division protein ZapA [Chlorobi bacterium]|nr:cell division protein ZapA [Chlorobiota bacterium]